MRLKTWMAALLAALILTLGMFAHPRECAAGLNDDVGFLQPPSGERGDPDTGGGEYFTQGFTSWVASEMRRFAVMWFVGSRRPTMSLTTTANTTRALGRRQ